MKTFPSLKRPATHHLLLPIVILLSIGIYSACRPLPTPAKVRETAPLPTPLMHRVTATPINIPAPTETPPPLPAPRPTTLADLVDQVYGSQIIEWIRIPSIHVFAPVVPVGWQSSSTAPDTMEWDSPDASVGWVVSSKLPHDTGNIIVYAHNNINASIFVNLYTLKPGDKIELETGEKNWAYEVSSVEIFPVPDAAADRELFDRFFQTSAVPVLTLVSCYPPTSNTHRVIVLAHPLPNP